MANVDKTVVAHLPIFAGISSGELDIVLREAQSMRFPKGTNLFRQNEEAHSFFIVLNGYLRVTKLTPEGKQVVVRFVGTGEICGVTKAIGRTTYPGTATAIVDTVALVWPSNSWPRLAAACPTLAANAFRTIGARLQDAHAQVVELSTEQVERRIAHALLRLADQAGRKVENGLQIDFPISRQDIAEMTGTTLHTVSRILSGWEGRGLIEGGRQRIVIREGRKLSALAEGLAHGEHVPGLGS